MPAPVRAARQQIQRVQRLQGVRLTRATLDEWKRIRGHHMAAAMSFYAILSLAPLLLASVAVAGLVWGDDAARGTLVVRMEEFVGPQMAEAADEIVRNGAAPVGSTTALVGSIALLLFSASRIFVHVRESLNFLFDVPDPSERGLRRFVRARASGLAMVFLVGGVVLVTLLVTAILAALTGPLEGRHPLLRVALHLVDLAFSVALLSLVFATLLRTVPQVRMDRGAALTGGLAIALGFVLGKTLLAIYLARTAAGSTYGSMGGAILVLVWIYYSALIFVLGATFTKTYALAHGLSIEPRVRTGFHRRRGAAEPPTAPSPRL